jgi:hypothetical protein
MEEDMRVKSLFVFLTVIGVSLFFLGQAHSAETATQGQAGWSQQAEETFFLTRGMGEQLMTQEEWANHQRQMQNMDEKEKENYRIETHGKLMERAQERGLLSGEMVDPHHGQKHEMRHGEQSSGDMGRSQ